MKLSAILAPLLSAKASHETIMEVVLAFESEQADALQKRRESDAKRQAEKRKRDAESRDVTLRHSDRLLATRVEGSSSNLDISGKLEEGRKQDFVSPTAQPKNGSRIPDDFEPDLLFAGRLGFGKGEAAHEAAQFLDYWRAKAGAGARKQDWPKTWQVWVRTAMSRRPTARAGPPRKPNAMDALSEIAIERGWDEPASTHSNRPDAGFVRPEPSRPQGIVVDLRGGVAGRYR